MSTLPRASRNMLAICTASSLRDCRCRTIYAHAVAANTLLPAVPLQYHAYACRGSQHTSASSGTAAANVGAASAYPPVLPLAAVLASGNIRVLHIEHFAHFEPRASPVCPNPHSCLGALRRRRGGGRGLRAVAQAVLLGLSSVHAPVHSGAPPSAPRASEGRLAARRPRGCWAESGSLR